MTISRAQTVGTGEGEMKTLTENQVAAGLLNDFIDVEHLEYFHLKPVYEVKISYWSVWPDDICKISKLSGFLV